jgi:hypothetical protein
MDSEESRTYDIKVTQYNNNPNKSINNQDGDKDDDPGNSLFSYQLCNACGKERACVICSLCDNNNNNNGCRPPPPPQQSNHDDIIIDNNNNNSLT